MPGHVEMTGLAVLRAGLFAGRCHAGGRRLRAILDPGDHAAEEGGVFWRRLLLMFVFVGEGLHQPRFGAGAHDGVVEGALQFDEGGRVVLGGRVRVGTVSRPERSASSVRRITPTRSRANRATPAFSAASSSEPV